MSDAMTVNQINLVRDIYSGKYDHLTCGELAAMFPECVPQDTYKTKVVKLLERWLYPEQRGDIMDLTHDTKMTIEQLHQ